MPRAEVVAVITFSWITGAAVPVAEITGCGCAIVLVISGSGTSAGFEAAPCRAIAFDELFVRAPLVGQIARAEDRPGDCVDQFGGGFGGGGAGAADDVSSADQGGPIRRLSLEGFRS